MPQDVAIITNTQVASLDSKARAALAGVDYVFSTYGNDIQFDNSGKLMMYENKSKLIQSVLKVLLTELGSAAEDPDYGSTIVTYLGEKMTHDSYTELVATVQEAMKHYNALNGDNDSSTEYIESIDSIEVSASPEDPRILVMKVTLTNEAGETIAITVPTVE